MKMRAVQVKTANAPFEAVEIDVRDPGPGEVRIKVEACGVCHSDALTRSGRYPGLVLPRVPGHEIAGRIDAVGNGVTNWKVGDRAGVGWYGGHCGECDNCRHGHFIHCRKGKQTGVSFDGGYAEYATVPAMAAARIPDGLDAADAGPLLCAGITTFNALRNSGARAGDTVAVQGIGGLGHLGIQYAAKMGFRTVALSTGSDKEALARQLGAHDYIGTSKVSAAEGLQKLGGAHLVLCTAPHSDAISATVGGLRVKGKVLVVSAAFQPLSFSALPLLGERVVTGWSSGTSIDSEETMAFSQMAAIKPTIEKFPLEQAEAAFTKVMKNEIRFRAVLVP